MEGTASQNAWQASGAFFMDRQLEKYRFGRTLKLEPSAYEFYVFYQVFPEYTYTLCKYVQDYISEEYPYAEWRYANTKEITNNPPPIQLVRTQKNEYYALFDYVCGGAL